MSMRLFASLHTHDTGWNLDCEASYSGYRRVELSRDYKDWKLIEGESEEDEEFSIEYVVCFPDCGSNTDLPVSNMRISDEKGQVLYSIALGNSIPLGIGITPQVRFRINSGLIEQRESEERFISEVRKIALLQK